MLTQYLISPQVAMEGGRPMAHTEPCEKRTVVHLTPSLYSMSKKELQDNPKRFRTQASSASYSEFVRSALFVYFNLKKKDPLLLQELRDQ